MTVKEQLHQLIDHLPDEEAEALLGRVTDRMRTGHAVARPSDLTRIYGTWEDDRSTDQVVTDLRRSRTGSRPGIEW